MGLRVLLSIASAPAKDARPRVGQADCGGIATVLLDTYLPRWDFREVHAVVVRATPERTFNALREVTPAEMPLVRLLLWIRSAPALVVGRRTSVPADRRPLLAQALRRPLRAARGETRVLLLELVSRRAFGRYWRLIQVGSAVIRMMWLQAIKRRAERPRPRA